MNEAVLPPEKFRSDSLPNAEICKRNVKTRGPLRDLDFTIFERIADLG